MQSKNFFSERQKQCQNLLRSWGVDCYLCENPPDIFYLVGMHLSLGRLLIQKGGLLLFVDGRYEEAAKKTAHCTVEKIKDAALERAITFPLSSHIRTIGFDIDSPYSRVQTCKKELKAFRKKEGITSPLSFKGLARPIQKMRAIKDAYEIKLIEKSAALLWEGFLFAKQKLCVGIEERQVALEFEFYCRNRGAERVSFPPIVAFGPHSALPHHQTGSRRLKQGDIVLMDLGICLNDYASDMTRTFFFGNGSKTLRTLHGVVAEAKTAALALCRPKVALYQLDQAARSVMSNAHLEDLFIHRLGHGVGLDVHELPDFRSDTALLEEGMVITIEPGLYLQGKGGVRLEDMVIITKTGHRNLFEE